MRKPAPVFLLAALVPLLAACTAPAVGRIESQGRGVVSRALPVPMLALAAPGIERGACVRVLSIDGGGIRGIIPALVLAEVERRTGERTARLFDVIVGTSSGGMLALGLSRPDPGAPENPAYTADDLVPLYEREGAVVFSGGAGSLLSLWGLLGPKYSPRGLEGVLRRYFAETSLAEALTLVEIPAYEIEERRHFFFRSDVHTSLMRDVARAATAAPSYFPPVTLPIEPRFSAKGHVTLIDGGVFANNPAPYALAAASAVRPGSRDILLVSLGTAAVPLPMPYEKAVSWGLIGWSRPLISMIFSDHGVEDAFRHVLPAGRYFRLQAKPPEVHRYLDDTSPDNVAALKRLAAQLIAERTDDLEALALALRSPRPADCPARTR